MVRIAPSGARRLVAPYVLPASLLKNWVQAGKFQRVSGVRYMVRRSLSFLLASALLLAGLALAGFEIPHAEALRPFVLIGALVIIGAAGLWLFDEFGGWLLRR